MILKQRLALGAVIAVLILNACGKDGPGDPGSSFSHARPTGSSAKAFLTSQPFTQLVVEIDYVQGLQPTPAALSNLESFLETYLNKPGGITILLDDEIQAINNTSITAQEIVDIENQFRDEFTENDRLAAYFVILDGRFEQENVLGVAYYNTSMALFEDLIQDNTGGFGQPSAVTVETTVMLHEFGHNLGLVGSGTPALTDHVDEENGAHCTTENCLMYYAVRDAGFMSNLMGGNIPELDEFCVQDLTANGGK